MRNPLLIALCFTAACATGPDYRAETPDAPSEFGGGSQEFPADEPAVDWWKAFQDPQLTEYVHLAVEANHDIAVATARVREARALHRAAASPWYPSISASTSYTRSRFSENEPGAAPFFADLGVTDLENDLYSAGFDASWEIDVFGRTRRAVEAADARTNASVQGRRDVLISVIAEVARNYIELRGAQRRLALAERNIGIQEETLALVRNRHKSGLVSALDVAQAETQLETTRAAVPPLRAATRAAAYRIAVLTGQQPRAAIHDLLPMKTLPEPPKTVPVGLPSSLLRRRPDVREAERRLHAATADIGAAIAELYPRFIMTGGLALNADSFSNWFEAVSSAWSIGPSITWPAFEGGRLRAQTDAARARRAAAYHQYQQVILIALEDVERRIIEYAQEQSAREDLARAAAASRRAYDLAVIRYDKGLIDFISVLDAERVLTNTDDRLAQTETAVLLELVQLYKALGGGWQSFKDPETLHSSTG